MSALMEQHERHLVARAGLGMGYAPPRVRRPPPPSPAAVVPVKKVRLTPPAPVAPEWPEQPPAVFYDDAAPRLVKTWRDIAYEVCAKHKVTFADVLGPSHKVIYVAPRHELIFRLTVELRLTATAVARKINRDHTSIISALNRYAKRQPGADAALRRVKAYRAARRKQLKAEAVAMYENGTRICDIMEALPLSRDTIRNAIKGAGLTLRDAA